MTAEREQYKREDLIRWLAYYADGLITRTELVSKIAEDRALVEMLPLPVSCFPPRETLRAEAMDLHLAIERGETITIGSNCAAPKKG